MEKFKALTPEEVRQAEQEAVKKFSGKEKEKLSAKESRGSRHTEEKKYKSLTPPWMKSWLGKYLQPFRSGKSAEETIKKTHEPEEEDKSQSRVLGRFKSVFPFMLFPDELIVEEKRVIWKNWLGPGLTSVISIMATDISNVQASHGPIFGHVHVGSLVGGPEILVERLRRKDAVKARALIEGIILSARESALIRKRKIEKEKEDLSRLGEFRF